MRSLLKNTICLCLFGIIVSMVFISCSKDKSILTPTDTSAANDNAETNNEEEVVFVPFDEPPVPVGGFHAIQAKLVYPEAARNAGVEGRVTIWVKIDETGEVVTTKVQQSLGPYGCDEAAIDAIKAVEWTPAKQRDVPVTVWIAVPVDFRLS